MSTRSPTPPTSTVDGAPRPRRRRWLITLGVIGGIVALGAAGIGVVYGILLPQQQKCIKAPDPSIQGAISEYCPPSPYEPFSGGGAMARGSDGNLWYVNGQQRITRFTVSSGAITEFAAPSSPNNVAFQGMVNGSDGNLWYIANYTLGRISMSGASKEFALPQNFGFSGSIAAGTGGVLWVTMGNNPQAQLLKITIPADPTAAPQITPVTLPSNTLEGIAAAPDGSVWVPVAVNSGDTVTATHILRVTPDGVISQLPLTISGGVSVLTAGAWNTMWFIDRSSHVGKISLAGVVTLFTVSTLSRDMPPMSLALGSDGNMWFPIGDGSIARITPLGVVTTYKLPHTGGGIANITAGSDAGVWFTLGFSQPFQPSSRIVRITP